MTAYQARDGWEALGDPSRLAIVTALAARPQAVGELAQGLPISRAAVSQHLKVLKVAGLVTDLGGYSPGLSAESGWNLRLA